MTPERWDKIDQVWQAVLARPGRERAAAVIELSAGDETLRSDVESLLAHLARASAAGFGAALSGVRAPRAVPLDGQLGPYTVQGLLGVGGMGEVYRAHDATLGRDVAIKILPEPWLPDPERAARFEREARLLASLNYPNIGAITASTRAALQQARGTRGCARSSWNWSRERRWPTGSHGSPRRQMHDAAFRSATSSRSRVS